jgi:hypothetical protein
MNVVPMPDRGPKRLAAEKKWRDGNRDKLRAKYNRYNRARQAFINSYKDRPCQDCGTRFPLVAMQFDHVRGKKMFNLSQFGMRSFARITAEIEKCEVVCANCHAVRTHRRKMVSLGRSAS